MREHPDSEGDPSAEEAEQDWVTGDRLWDHELTSVTLCRFSGITVDGGCPARRTSRHPDVDCEELFIARGALKRGEIDLTDADAEAGVVSVPFDGTGTPTGKAAG